MKNTRREIKNFLAACERFLTFVNESGLWKTRELVRSVSIMNAGELGTKTCSKRAAASSDARTYTSGPGAASRVETYTTRGPSRANAFAVHATMNKVKQFGHEHEADQNHGGR
jgi:hypothetical protein